jgi:pimeloyl-ACP methyl ester carboxylesterase
MLPPRQIVSVRGTDLEVLVLGSGKPLLFLHGESGPDVPSDAFISELARGFRVIAPFHPGFGSKDRPKNIRDVSDLAYLYLDLIEERQLTSLVLVGASFGGWIAAEIAIRNSMSLSHLILSAPLGIKVRGRDERDIEDIFAMTDSEYASVAFADQSKARWLADDPNDEELASHFRCKESLAFYGWKPYMHNPQLMRWLHRIQIPTLLIAGQDDRMVFEGYYAAYGQSIPGAKILFFENAGHFPHLEQPARFARAALEFVTDRPNVRVRGARGTK